MSEKIYVDTNVWLDYLYNRTDKLRPLGEFAFELFRKSVACAYTIVISDWVLDEVSKYDPQKRMADVLIWLKEAKKVEVISTTYELKQKAKKQAHWQDVLHALLAEEASVSFLVTRNIIDFSGSWYSFKVKLPEQL
ncbi:MAG: type II toxin-antitoxin system VapC family toxin [Candidatus Woesearchaeota archaeon]